MHGRRPDLSLGKGHDTCCLGAAWSPESDHKVYNGSFRLFNFKLVSNLLTTFYISGRNQWRAKLLAFEQPDEVDQRQTMRKTAFQGSFEERSEGVTLSSQFFSALIVLYNDFVFIYDM